jgi:ATP-binding cassette subfamily B protein RaxB
MLGMLAAERGRGALRRRANDASSACANVRRRIGTVMQDDVLLTGSLVDNISFFDAYAGPPARRGLRADWRKLHEEIVRMPMGYHTLVGDLGSWPVGRAEAAHCCWRGRCTSNLRGAGHG